MMRTLILLMFLVVLLPGITWAQKIRKIDIEADVIQVNKRIAPDAKRLLNNVVFRHEGVLMYCDSAYFYSERNSLDAFSRVFINQGDTLKIYSDFLFYDGNTRVAKAKENVKLIDIKEDGETVLYTDELDFDLNDNVGYYQTGGKVISGDNELHSLIGYYFSNEDLYFFKDSVKIYTEDYTIFSDTVKYNTVTGVSYFFGPTEIISEENYIYCEDGWYDNTLNHAQFSENAYLISEGMRLKGDSMYYDRNEGYGEAFQNMELYDSVENIIIRGDYGLYRESVKSGVVTDNALFIQVVGADSLFLHADTLRSDKDTVAGDTAVVEHNLIRAYYGVKIFRFDMQAMCDSLTYFSGDSVFRLYVNPVLWSEENQITADYIELYTGDGSVDSLKMYSNSFIISEEDTSWYNQIKGKDMIGYFVNNELARIHVFGNGETIYFPKDQDEIMGVNKSSSKDMMVVREDKKIKRIYFISTPEAVFMPLPEKGSDEMILKGFRWLEKYRPKQKEDIFIREEKSY